MEMKKIKLLFEKKVYMDIVSDIIDKDKAFLYSLLKLSGCEECPEGINIKLGLIIKEEEK